MSQFSARRIHADERHTVVVVQSSESGQQIDGGRFGIYAYAEPVAVVVSGAEGAWAVDTDGQPTDLERLLCNVDELHAILG